MTLQKCNCNSVLSLGTNSSGENQLKALSSEALRRQSVMIQCIFTFVVHFCECIYIVLHYRRAFYVQYFMVCNICTAPIIYINQFL